MRNYSINNKNLIPLIQPFIIAVGKIKDNRIKKPIIKKLSDFGSKNTLEFRAHLHTQILLNIESSESNFQFLKEIMLSQASENQRHKVFEAVLENISYSKEKLFSEKLLELILNNIFLLNDENIISEIILKVLFTLNREAKIDEVNAKEI